METIDLETLRYPVGKFAFNDKAGSVEADLWIAEIGALPQLVRKAVSGLSDKQLDTVYRDGGWTVRQVVHHMADSHLNAYIRIKLALTEDKPTIKPYEENAWAALEDSKLPVDVSLRLLDSLHERWTFLNRQIPEKQLARTVYHPESKREMSVQFLLALYAWHGRHHTAHITSLRVRMKW